MRILILGGDGMLGHQLMLHLQAKHQVAITLRKEASSYSHLSIFKDIKKYTSIDISHPSRLIDVLADFQPDAVINAVGIVKQRPTALESIPSIETNALFPHRLGVLCKAAGARMIQFSTDCIFSGKKGMYTEEDLSDAEDLYGKTKYLGEVHDSHCVTLRISTIGPELNGCKGLIGWFQNKQGIIKGFKNAIYTGLTTLELNRLVEKILIMHRSLSGLWQVASSPISKYTLLQCLATKLNRTDITISPDEDFICDRSLSNEKFFNQTGYEPPSWDVMLSELAETIQNNKMAHSQGVIHA
jgi:dTDP-4-dehydrorhamnose reductase